MRDADRIITVDRGEICSASAVVSCYLVTEPGQGNRRRMWRYCLFAIGNLALVLAPARAYAELRDKLSPPSEYASIIMGILVAHLFLNYKIIQMKNIKYKKIIFMIINLVFCLLYFVILNEMYYLNIPAPWRIQYHQEGYSFLYIFPVIGLFVPVGAFIFLNKKAV